MRNKHLENIKKLAKFDELLTDIKRINTNYARLKSNVQISKHQNFINKIILLKIYNACNFRNYTHFSEIKKVTGL